MDAAVCLLVSGSNQSALALGMMRSADASVGTGHFEARVCFRGKRATQNGGLLVRGRVCLLNCSGCDTCRVPSLLTPATKPNASSLHRQAAPCIWPTILTQNLDVHRPTQLFSPLETRLTWFMIQSLSITKCGDCAP